ncbi:hypothetical protein BPT24_053 [Tenacibaculum phage pT24]|uniref:Uncharacterized protein n=1 Tax=Tenacibaculum phage pT24 TaxID=1880590 RepID=A0A1B4XWJ1_9CAUD|nr:hypothetical protein HYP10_gp053 [Tenacibaculum phage pT24]BAV39176.1 hypothetical protein BPT24_053 [Tenacibaculum phage pT24]
MEKSRYLELREEFYKKYEELLNDESSLLGVEIHKLGSGIEFRKFMYIFSFDNMKCGYSNVVSSIIGEDKAFLIRFGFKHKIQIRIKHSMVDKFECRYDLIMEQLEKQEAKGVFK